jgi:ubiquinol-cytochrome c reductase iron-sulfur subunit
VIVTVDEKKRRFLIHTLRALGGLGFIGLLRPFFSSWLPNAQVRAQAKPLRVSVAKLQPGEKMTVIWRGKPIWIIRRTSNMLAQLMEPNSALRDPNSLTAQQPPYAKNPYRSRDPKYLVLVGLCTHLGCIPRYEPERESGGFFCPCHGSRFDLSGRVFKDMPAPVNLEVPPYRVLEGDWIEIGEEYV